MIRSLKSSQSQPFENEDLFTSTMQNLSRWIINQKNHQNSSQINFSEILSENQEIQGTFESTKLIEEIKEQLRDSSNAIVSTQIHQYNFKSSKKSGNIMNSTIHQCFSSISYRILTNYMNTLKILILKNKQSKETQKETKLKSSFDELQDFMKHCIQYMEMKYINYCGEDQDGMMVLPTIEVNNLIEKLQKQIVHTQLHQQKTELKNLVSSLSDQAPILRDIEKALKDQLNSFIASAKYSISKYQQILNKIDPQINLRSKQDFNQLLGQNKIMVDTFITQIKPSFILKLMSQMLKILKSKIGNNKFLPVTTKKKDKFLNILQQKDFNKKVQQISSQKTSKRQKKQEKTQTVVNDQVSGKNQKSSLNQKSQITFSRFFQQSYFDQYNQKNKSHPQLISEQEVISIAYDYSEHIYQQVLKQLSNQLSFYINLTKSRLQKYDQISNQEKQKSSVSSIFSTLVRRILTSSEENSLVTAHIQCGNQKLFSILKQISQLAISQQIDVWKVQNSLRKEDNHSLRILFALKKQRQIPCHLEIRLDQRLSTSKVLRYNYRMLYNYLRQLRASSFGVIGQMALYSLSINGSKL